MDDRRILDAIDTSWAHVDALRIPLWIFCFERRQIVWANAAARALWDVPDNDTMRRRDLTADMSEARVGALYSFRERVRSGETVTEAAVIYPRGVAKRVHLVHHHVRLPDGTDAMCTETDIEPPAE